DRPRRQGGPARRPRGGPCRLPGWSAARGRRRRHRAAGIRGGVRPVPPPSARAARQDPQRPARGRCRQQRQDLPRPLPVRRHAGGGLRRAIGEMARGRIALGSAAALTAAAVLLLGGVLRGPASAQPIVGAPGISPESMTTGFALGGTPQLVERLQAAVRAAPQDVRSLDLLGLAYQQRARETGDPAYYTKSDGVLRRALGLQPNDLLATSGLGSLALSRHRFRTALVLGRQARAISPSTARNYGVTGDALVELGRYREAFAAFDRMGALKPSLASYARVAHARELLGDVPGAIQAMKLALDSAAGEPEATAWTSVQLGKIYWSTGRLAAARTLYRAALEHFPGYVYAFDALAQVEAARGHLRRA